MVIFYFERKENDFNQSWKLIGANDYYFLKAGILNFLHKK